MGIKTNQDDYDHNYMNLAFEDLLRIYRRKKVLGLLQKYPHARILEIGCGPDPLFQHIEDFESMVVVEPSEVFYNMAKEISSEIKNVRVFNQYIEKEYENLLSESFDFIIIGGFLHEIENPDEVLEVVREICNKSTLVLSIVPNANSFHRLIAEMMGTIDNVYEKSENDKLFGRKIVFDINSHNELLVNNMFKVIESGSYFCFSSNISFFISSETNFFFKRPMPCSPDKVPFDCLMKS